jgi:hypothetical protein
MQNRFPAILAAAFLILLSAPASAQSGERYASVSDIPHVLVAPLYPQKRVLILSKEMAWQENVHIEARYLKKIIDLLEGYQGAEKGLNEAAISARKQRKYDAVVREQIGGILFYDENMDGKVTEPELREGLIRDGLITKDSPYQHLSIQFFLDRYDDNHDKVISFAELRIPRDTETTELADERIAALEALLALDPDKDGFLTIEEARLLALKAFRTFDTNSDGLIDDAENKAGAKALGTLPYYPTYTSPDR